MKIKRYKKAYKNLNFYVNNFGFHKPFQLLIDGTFCFAALQNRILIKEDIPKYLGSEIKFLTTQCNVIESEKFGHQIAGTTKIIKTFGVHNCGHNKNILSGSQCLLSMVGSQNLNRYIIATQDKDLQTKLQDIPSVPIMYINRTSIILKSPSECTILAAKNKKESILRLTDYQEKILTSLKMKTFKNVGKEKIVSYPKKPKGPNPLSCKKKKKSLNVNINNTSANECLLPYKKRRRIRLAAHIKEELYGISTK